jgi:hypothetical protein
VGAAFLSGAASALDIANGMTGVASSDPWKLASGADDASGDLIVRFAPSVNDSLGPESIRSARFLETDSIIAIEVEGAVFSSSAGIVFGNGFGEEGVDGLVANLSTGGAKGGNRAEFFIKGDDLIECGYGAPDARAPDALAPTCQITIPVALTGGDVTVGIGIETAAGRPVDNSSLSNLQRLKLVKRVKPFKISIEADQVPTIASLDVNKDGAVFTAFESGSRDNVIGAVNFDLSADVYKSLSLDSKVRVNDIDKIMVTLDGDLGAFSEVLLTDTSNNDDKKLVVSSNKDAAALSFSNLQAVLDGGPHEVSLIPDGKTAIPVADYKLTAKILAKAESGLSDLTRMGSLQSVERDGASILFPWTQSAVQGAESGVTSVYRLSNTGELATGKVCVEAKSSTVIGYDKGIECPENSIDAGSEIVWTSADIERFIGDYGRGDLEFTIEGAGTSLTARQFVVRGDSIQQVRGGTLAQDTQ